MARKKLFELIVVEGQLKNQAYATRADLRNTFANQKGESTMTNVEQLDRIRDAFRQAALDDVPHVTNIGIVDMEDLDTHIKVLSRGVGDTGYCALGWLQHVDDNVLDLYVSSCPLCGARTATIGGIHDIPIRMWADLLVHYNNDHEMSWLDLANKI